MALTTTSAMHEVAAAYQTDDPARLSKEKSEYGKTIGEPKLSESGKKYYDELKKKYKGYDFILVSKDQIANAKSQVAKYANPTKPVVLIDEDKIERMATDPEYRKKYEGIISGAANDLNKLKESITASGAKVEGYGIQVNDGGMTSFFAVVKKSQDAQAERIENKRAKAREEHKAAEKKEKKKAEEERIKEKRAKAREKEDAAVRKPGEDEEVISASSIEELQAKLEGYAQDMRMNTVMTQEEKTIGQNIDFRG